MATAPEPVPSLVALLVSRSTDWPLPNYGSGLGPAKGLLEQAEGVLDVEAAEEGLPAVVDVGFGGAGAVTTTARPAC
ncbi:hypothetical protein ACFVP3_38940 [Streptomyces sp. NPDC057806]|uniref:hypothetical protein n=1 Tax=Streptomyces sp. NPDC057806 TaxID=3346255 RepID=UPI0036766E57